MPASLTYPGVYIQEKPSGVRTITGIATSIAAFIGRTMTGPVNEPVTVNSFGDFERLFGGLWELGPMSFAVRDFFLNGGAQAIIVRLYRPDDGANPKTRAQLVVGTGKKLTLVAANEGAWGNHLVARVDHASLGDDTFNLFIRDRRTDTRETHRNLSIAAGHPRNVAKVLERDSRLVRAGALPDARPEETPTPEAAKDPLEPPNAIEVQNAAKATDGRAPDEAAFRGSENAKTGLYALDKADLFNLLCLPPATFDEAHASALWDEAAAYCRRRRAMLIVDPPPAWTTKDAATAPANMPSIAAKDHAAIYFPRLRQPNPLRDGAIESFVPCGAVAGVFARTDATRGVWKAPAGLDATLAGVPELALSLTDAECGELNPLGINCLRAMPAAGRVIWGARTLAGDDRLASEWKYVPVRRLALFIEESLFRGTQWVVFEPNDEALWAQIRLNLGAFMNTLFRQGAFAGSSPRDAYFVKCDRETTTQADVDRGVVNILVGFAPAKPAEFVVITIQQMAGQLAG